MAIPDPTKLASCQAAAARGDWVTVFDGASGTTGANEGTGVTRAQTVWSDNVDKVVGSEVNVPCGAGTYVEAGAFSASSAGSFAGADVFTGGNVIVSGSGGSIDVTLTWQ